MLKMRDGDEIVMMPFCRTLVDAITRYITGE